MFNPLPLLALGAVAIGYSGAIERVDRAYDLEPNTTITAFTAASDLSVHSFVGKLPETVQDPFCDTKDVITASLSDDFAETLESAWLQEQTVKMELWTSDLMGTWTLLHLGSSGDSNALACIVSSGFGWVDGMGVDDVLQDHPVS